MKGQKQLCVEFLEREIEKLEDQAEEEGTFDYGYAEVGMTTLKMLHNVITSQDVKEPLDDIVFYVGYPEKDTPCYHVLVRPEDCTRMGKNPYIKLCHIKKFTGVMEQDNKPAKKLVDKDGKTYCVECGRRIYKRYRPFACPGCGTTIDYSGEWWWKE